MSKNKEHKCLSCPTMIVDGDYCSECSDTPDGRSKYKFDYRLHVRSKYNKDQIQIHTEYPKDGPLSMLNQSFNNPVVEVINLKEALVRKDLIDLGWTPPPELRCPDCGELPKGKPGMLEPHICKKSDPYGVNTPRGKQSLDSEQRFFDPK